MRLVHGGLSPVTACLMLPCKVLFPSCSHRWGLPSSAVCRLQAIPAWLDSQEGNNTDAALSEPTYSKPWAPRSAPSSALALASSPGQKAILDPNGAHPHSVPKHRKDRSGGFHNPAFHLPKVGHPLMGPVGRGSSEGEGGVRRGPTVAWCPSSQMVNDSKKTKVKKLQKC